MQIFASIRGTFLEPFEKNQDIEDLVTSLQFEAQSAQETQVLLGLLAVIQRGGVLKVSKGKEHGFFISVKELGPPIEGQRASAEGTTASAKTTRTKIPIMQTTDVALPQPVPAIPGEPAHEHRFTAKLGSKADSEGVWLKCSCNQWQYFDRRPVGMRKKRSIKELN